MYYIESELNITYGCLLTPRCLRENVYYVKKQRIYRNVDRCLRVPTDGSMSTSKKMGLLSMTVIYFCPHLVCMTSIN